MEGLEVFGNTYKIDRDCLSFIEGNRPVKMDHIQNINRAMRDDEFIPPIIVNKSDLTIIDGQHRYAAAQKFWQLGIPYTLEARIHDFKDPLAAAIQYNCKSKTWNTKEFVDSYVFKGVEGYRLLDSFCKSHSLCMVGKGRYRYANACELILGSRPRFSDGILEITQEQIAEAESIYLELQAIVEATGTIRVFTRGIIPWLKMREEVASKCSFPEYLELLQEYYIEPSTDGRKEWKQSFIDVIHF